jgi:hypothetical protein|tara:strand:- start:2082 stop:2690 length:609 start_codon:yes stop_codon:yes gene_type:complete
MSEYFKNMPALYYKFDTGTNHAGKKIDIIHQKLVTDISLRHRLKSSIKSAVYTKQLYNIPEGERADTLSLRYYGGFEYVWLIFLANNILDPIFDWPLSQDELRKHIICKYGSLDAAHSGVHHYEEILQKLVPASAGQERIEERFYEVDATRYQLVAAQGDGMERTVSDYEYEILRNDSKKTIALIDDSWVEQILETARNMFS